MSDPQQDNTPFVLIADDDPDTLDVLCFLAQHKGWRVDRATTAREIIEKVNYHCSEVRRCYDAILSDVNFFDNQPGPRLTGITAIGQIRKKWPHIPVVFYSAFLNTAMRDLIKQLGNAQAVEKSGRSQYGDASTDPVGAIERVEIALTWCGKPITKYEGPDRRVAQEEPHPNRRAGECESGDVNVPPVLEGAMTEARALRELRAIAGLRDGK